MFQFSQFHAFRITISNIPYLHMHKIFDWFRGEKVPDYDQDNHHRRWSIKHWKSSEKLKSSIRSSRQNHKQKNGGQISGDRGGSRFSEHFDAVASTSSPANLALLGTTNGNYNIR